MIGLLNTIFIGVFHKMDRLMWTETILMIAVNVILLNFVFKIMLSICSSAISRYRSP